MQKIRNINAKIIPISGVGNFPVILPMKFIFLVQTGVEWRDASYTAAYLQWSFWDF